MPDSFSPGTHRQDGLYRFAKLVERKLPASFVPLETTRWGA
jgi:hypothetical protein